MDDERIRRYVPASGPVLTGPGNLRSVYTSRVECGPRKSRCWIVDDFRLGTFRTPFGALWARCTRYVRTG